MLALERHGGVELLVLERPDKRNALSVSLRLELAGAFERLAGEEGVGCAVLTGAGSAFCSGLDTDEFGGDEANRRALLESTARCFRAVAHCPRPVVAAVNGPALGGGFALALLCDVRLAATTATFGFPGLAQGIPASYAAARAVLGPAAARELAFTGRAIDAEEARSLGVVSEVLSPGALRAGAMALADRIARAPRWAVLETKRRALLDAERSWEPLLDDELRALEEVLLRPRPDSAA
jgi:enoyl-CoA hydratase/carnithine racemase